MAPCYYAGIIAGSHVFRRTREGTLRQLALVLLMSVSAVALLR
jgi:hypothetical protein